MKADKVEGILHGAALGDALGGPYEFRNQVSLDKYTGHLVHPLSYTSRFQGTRMGVVGQLTDDTEMTIVLADTIIAKGRYDPDAAIEGYLKWANSKVPFMGRNTRALFQGVKTVCGYQRRFAKIAAGTPQDEQSQSNGCLMRSTPLAALPDWYEAARKDCSLTNPHPNCVDGVRVYVGAVRGAAAGYPPEAILERAIDLAEEGDVVDVLMEIRHGVARPVADRNRGWILHALYCAFWAVTRFDSYEDAIDWTISQGGDTDTNGCIAGGLIGARLGYEAMTAEDRTGHNIPILRNCDPGQGFIDRPAEYRASRLAKIAKDLAALDPEWGNLAPEEPDAEDLG